MAAIRTMRRTKQVNLADIVTICFKQQNENNIGKDVIGSLFYIISYHSLLYDISCKNSDYKPEGSGV